MKFITLLLFIVLINILSACKKSTKTPVTNISGEWFQQRQREGNLVNLETFNFKSDQSVDITWSVVDTIANQTKGYVRRQTGAYSYKGDSVILENMKSYSVGSYTYKKLEELEYINTEKRFAYKIAFNKNKDLLTLEFSCPPYADCIPHPKLKRVKKLLL